MIVRREYFFMLFIRLQNPKDTILQKLFPGTKFDCNLTTYYADKEVSSGSVRFGTRVDIFAREETEDFNNTSKKYDSVQLGEVRTRTWTFSFTTTECSETCDGML